MSLPPFLMHSICGITNENFKLFNLLKFLSINSVHKFRLYFPFRKAWHLLCSSSFSLSFYLSFSPSLSSPLSPIFSGVDFARGKWRSRFPLFARDEYLWVAWHGLYGEVVNISECPTLSGNVMRWKDVYTRNLRQDETSCIPTESALNYGRGNIAFEWCKNTGLFQRERNAADVVWFFRICMQKLEWKKSFLTARGVYVFPRRKGDLHFFVVSCVRCFSELCSEGSLLVCDFWEMVNSWTGRVAHFPEMWCLS